MSKRLLILAGCLCLALLTNLSFRVPTTAQAQAACQTSLVPTFTLGTQKNLSLPGGGVLRDGDLFYLGASNGVKFTTSSPGALLLTRQPSEFLGAGFPGYPGTTATTLQTSTANSVATAISCLDSFWDINFVLYGGSESAAGVANDSYEFFLQQPDGSGRIRLVEFKNTPDGTGTTVTYVIPGGDLSAVGHTPTTLGRLIPYELQDGNTPEVSQNRTNLITLAFPMDGSVPNCAQLGVTIRKANGTLRSMVGLINLVVSRSAATTATGTGIQSGIAGLTYPTALVCPVVCPACPTPPSCDLTICFADACTWCNRLDFPGYRRDYWVRIPGVNFGLPVSPYSNFSLLVRQALGCNGFVRLDVYSKLVAEYVAAQLSVQHQVAFWYPQLSKQKLACHVTRMLMTGQTRAIPVTLSGGPNGPITLTGDSSLQDLFDATDWAAAKGTSDDRMALLNIYKQLNNCTKD